MIKTVFFLGSLLIANISIAQHSLVNKETIFNSYADEQNPVFSPNRDVLYFVRAHYALNEGKRKDYGDIWFSTYDSTLNNWTLPSNIGPVLNNQFYNGVLGFGKKGDMYLYNTYESVGDQSKLKGISVAKPITPPKKWTAPTPMPIKYFHALSNNHGISISSDGKIMLLSLESFKTKGEEDIYVSFWVSALKSWSEPKNLGSQINTLNQEVSPFLALDNKTLFFSSNGYKGLGSKDVFSAKRLDDSWTNWSVPKNLGEEINSEGEEIYFQYFPSQSLAIYTSTKNSNGYGDIHFKDFPLSKMTSIIGYEISNEDEKKVVAEPVPKKQEATAHLVGLITNAETNTSIEATVSVTGDHFKKYHSYITSFDIEVPIASEYLLVVEANGFISYSEKINIKKETLKQYEHNVALQPIKLGTTVKLDLVLFFKGTVHFTEESYKQLELMVQMMKENSTMEIKLEGHTDNIGNPGLNRVLSQERVNAVINYFVANGIEATRLNGEGYGGEKPIASNQSEETRRLNRRVEFTITKQ